MESIAEAPWVKGTEQMKLAKTLAAYNMGRTGLVDALNKMKADGVDIYGDVESILPHLPSETRNYVQGYLEDGGLLGLTRSTSLITSISLMTSNMEVFRSQVEKIRIKKFIIFVTKKGAALSVNPFFIIPQNQTKYHSIT